MQRVDHVNSSMPDPISPDGEDFAIDRVYAYIEKSLRRENI